MRQARGAPSARIVRASTLHRRTRTRHGLRVLSEITPRRRLALLIISGVHKKAMRRRTATST
jgi:hypothetical protein